jgi:hypothetical protein
MKALPEKLVMAAIILSCGVVAHLEPAAQQRQVKRATVASLHTWQQILPGAAAPGRSSRIAKYVAAQAEIP